MPGTESFDDLSFV